MGSGSDTDTGWISSLFLSLPHFLIPIQIPILTKPTSYLPASSVASASLPMESTLQRDVTALHRYMIRRLGQRLGESGFVHFLGGISVGLWFLTHTDVDICFIAFPHPFTSSLALIFIRR